MSLINSLITRIDRSKTKDANSLGSKFALVPDYIVKQERTFWQEIQYLIENGIPWEMF